MHTYTVEQIRLIERYYVDDGYGKLDDLMEKAGAGAWKHLSDKFPDVQSVDVVCGGAGNGGDGYVLARHAQCAGLKVTIYCVKNPVPASLTDKMYQLAQESGVNIVPFTTHTKFDADVIVDALMGIGTEGIVQGDIRCAIDKINSTQKPVLSIDIPSGLNANTGEPCGIAVKANFTITFIGLKCGLLADNTQDYVGEVILETLGIKGSLLKKIEAAVG